MQTVFGRWSAQQGLVRWAAILMFAAGAGCGGSSSPEGDTPRRGDAATDGSDSGSASDTKADTSNADTSNKDALADAPDAKADLPLDRASEAPPDAPADKPADTSGPCTTANDCPGQDTECVKRTCVQGVCGTATLAPGLPVPLQVAGDCKVRQCDATGQVAVVADNSDLPEDGNPCTLDVCTAGLGSHPPAALGSACGGTNKCNGAGQCVGCNVATDCAGDDNVCQTRTCVSNVCGFNRIAAGTPVASQTVGDCKVVQCDGQGNTVTVNDNTDIPVDNDACTTDTCMNGTPSNPPLAAGTTCGNGRTCDGSGRCGQCNTAADCGTSNECRTYSCTAQGTCQSAFAASGTPLTAQSPGDCKVAQCDGAGNTMQVNDDTDLPVDGNPCTQDVCTNGTPTNPPAPNTTACGNNNHCDGSGHCLGCAVAADCGTNTDCRMFTCSAQGVCGSTTVAAGTPTSNQTAHDCKQNQCDGNGNVVSANLDSDTPADDGNVCTIEGCSSGAPTSTAASTSTTCNTNGGTHCDGAGMCVGAPPAATFMVLRVVAGTNLGVAVGAPIVLEQRSVDTGAVMNTIAMPTLASPVNGRAVMISGKATSEGWLTRSDDTHYLLVAGYNPPDATTKVVSTATVPRVVARVNAAGTVETAGVASTAFVTDNLRGAASTNGTDIWAFGDGSNKSGGAWYVSFNSNTDCTPATPPASCGAQIFGNLSVPPAPSATRTCLVHSATLYCTSDKTNFAGVFTVGPGNAPMAGPQPANILSGFTGAGQVPYQIAFAASDRFYLADAQAPPTGGIRRWTLQTGTWMSVDNFNTGTFGAQGALAIPGTNSTIVLATTADVDSGGSATMNHILKFVDTGTGAPAATTLATAPDGSFFRGLALPAQ